MANLKERTVALGNQTSKHEGLTESDLNNESLWVNCDIEVLVDGYTLGSDTFNRGDKITRIRRDLLEVAKDNKKQMKWYRQIALRVNSIDQAKQ